MRYNVAAFVISFNMICNMTMFKKKLNFDIMTPSARVVRGGLGSVGKYLLPCCCIL